MNSTKKYNKRFILMILDGWGIGKKDKADAIFQANTPHIDRLMQNYSHTQLLTMGENVGLPDGQMGNSEVGHMNIGAGRIIYQDLVKINKAVADGSIAENPVLKAAFENAKTTNSAVHFIGLVSDGGVHSLDKHLYKLCELSAGHGLEKVYIHALTDGRDCDPESGYGFIDNLQKAIKNTPAKIASLTGRYYTMDRDKRWERVKVGYDLMVHGQGTPTRDLLQSIKDSYDQGVTDEFIKPLVCVDEENQPVGKIKSGDTVICFNFRTDRLREITTVLTQTDMSDEGMKTLDLNYYTMTRYDDSFKGIHVIYDKENIDQTLGETISEHGLRQIRIAETEKYAHVTFFFSGGREKEFENEKRILVSSPKVATYDLQPQMSAYLVKDKILKEINEQSAEFICLNFANGDMVGHTGQYDAIIKAIESVDDCVGQVVEAARKHHYDVMIIADHGNADHAINADGSINTAHSLNPVPCILISDAFKVIHNGILADVAPSILKIMGIPIPDKMNGKILVE